MEEMGKEPQGAERVEVGEKGLGKVPKRNITRVAPEDGDEDPEWLVCYPGVARIAPIDEGQRRIWFKYSRNRQVCALSRSVPTIMCDVEMEYLARMFAAQEAASGGAGDVVKDDTVPVDLVGEGVKEQVVKEVVEGEDTVEEDTVEEDGDEAMEEVHGECAEVAEVGGGPEAILDRGAQSLYDSKDFYNEVTVAAWDPQGYSQSEVAFGICGDMHWRQPLFSSFFVAITSSGVAMETSTQQSGATMLWDGGFEAGDVIGMGAFLLVSHPA
jgi:hypothetical protein